MLVQEIMATIGCWILWIIICCYSALRQQSFGGWMLKMEAFWNQRLEYLLGVRSDETGEKVWLIRTRSGSMLVRVSSDSCCWTDYEDLK